MFSRKPTILVIFGISGDLSKRYLLPAISSVAKAGMLPDDFRIIGLTRQVDINKNDLIKKIDNPDYIFNHLEIKQLDIDSLDDFKNLGSYLNKIEKEFNIPAQILFYLSVPPQASKFIIEMLGLSGLSSRDGTKLLLEKPFGTDLENATQLVKYIDKYFTPEQVYRVDHYMAKEMVQNIIVFREGNSLFRKTWNKDFIESIEVVVSEKLSIEGRVNFYEQTGALRDMVQSHLLQLLSLALMELPTKENLEEVPSLRLKALENLKIKNIGSCKRGQYKGYKDEVSNLLSQTETFTSIEIESDDPKWIGIPMKLITGKVMNEKFTEIRILYKKENKTEHESNKLIINIQPKGGIEFNIWAKHPGYEFKVNPHSLSFNFEEYYGVLPEAYEQVLFSAINGDHSLFTSSEEVIETWKILDLLQKEWQKNDNDLVIYEKGSEIDELK